MIKYTGRRIFEITIISLLTIGLAHADQQAESTDDLTVLSEQQEQFELTSQDGTPSENESASVLEYETDSYEQEESEYLSYQDEDENLQTSSLSEDQSVTHEESFPSENDLLTISLPGEEVDFKLKLHQSTFHFVHGRAQSDIGKILFKSRLMPSNEVKLSLKLKQKDAEDIELTAYFDLANFTMELDGSNAVLNQHHKELMEILNQHLRSEFEVQYKDYDFPEHALMLVQMLSYWSVSPAGYAHEKRSIVANH